MLGFFLYNALVHKIELAVKSRFKSISLRHQKKLLKFRKAQTGKKCDINPRLRVEIHALPYGLHHYISTSVNRKVITTEFELFFRSLLRDISNIPRNEINKVKLNYVINMGNIAT